ncbi:hypothetical protein ACGTJS_04980 [Faucicola mancuniensis]|uniref:hypothetical protein n=1 Tax=Faucicola mancuniensis TaxID=1309795 RepID=UPI0028E86C5D|nr:hypothetical protein [uncultured Moraxella sp.]
MLKFIWQYLKIISVIAGLYFAKFLPLYIGINCIIIFLYLMAVKTQMHIWLLVIGIIFMVAGYFALKRMTTDHEMRNLAIGAEGLLMLMILPTLFVLWLLKHFSN